MQAKRMSKNWIWLGDNLDQWSNSETELEKNKREQKFRNAIKMITKRDEAEMIKNSELTAIKRNEYNAQLLEAFNNKKLKSKKIIKQAQLLKKKNKTASISAETAE
jgi:hypothetical protein